MFNVDCSYNKSSGYLTHAPTLEEAVAKGAWARDFYGALYPGTVSVVISLICESCKGSGRMAKGRKNVRFPRYVDCAHCRAAGVLPVPAVV